MRFAHEVITAGKDAAQQIFQLVAEKATGIKLHGLFILLNGVPRGYVRRLAAAIFSTVTNIDKRPGNAAAADSHARLIQQVICQNMLVIYFSIKQTVLVSHLHLPVQRNGTKCL